MEKEFEYLENNGSEPEMLNQIKEEFDYSIKHHSDLSDALFQVELDIKAATRGLLKETNRYDQPIFNSLVTTMFCEDYENDTELNITCLAGNVEVDGRTLFDVSSTTKLYTILTAFRLEEIECISFDDKLIDICPVCELTGDEDFKISALYPQLGDITIRELMTYTDEFRTIGSIVKSKSDKEAVSILRSAYLKGDRRRNSVKDLGAVILGDVLAHAYSKLTGRKYSFADVVRKILLEPLNICYTDTTLSPKKQPLLGSGKNYQSYDGISKALGGSTGAAGVFTTSHGLVMLSRRLFKANTSYDWFEAACSKQNVLDISKPVQLSDCGILGTEIKGSKIVPAIYSDSAFGYQGVNGATAIFDPKLFIHNNFLVDAWNASGRLELAGHMHAYDTYRDFITKETILTMLIKKYYERKEESFSIIKTFKVR